MDHQIDIHLRRKVFIGHCLGGLLLTGFMAWASRFAWLTLDPDWHLPERRFHWGALRFLEQLPHWIRGPWLGLAPLLYFYLLGPGMISGVWRIVRREPVAVLNDQGIRAWGPFGSSQINWAEATAIEAKRSSRIVPFFTIKVHGKSRTGWRWTSADVVLSSDTMVIDVSTLMAFLRKKRFDLCALIE